MDYDLEADWLLLTTCGFRCNYCFFPSHTLGAKIRVYATPAQWARAYDATGRKWLLHITGGEPSLYPGFVDLCQQLTRKHYLSINSNLAHRSIDAFAETIDPRRVHFVNAAVHPEEREKHGSLDTFIGRVHRLRKCGFKVLISVVMTPWAIDNFPNMARYFGAKDVALIPKVMRGRYRESDYPTAYSSREKGLILEYLGQARRKYAPLIASMGEPPTINVFADGRFLNGVPDYRGKLCGAGRNFVRINPDGAVFRCSPQEYLGNVLMRTVKFLSRPKPCDTSYCPYFCEKYTAPPFVNAQLA